MFLLCSPLGMNRIEQSEIADLIPTRGWARLGIAAPAAHLRWDAANELAQAILDRLSGECGQEPDGAQLGLSL